MGYQHSWTVQKIRGEGEKDLRLYKCSVTPELNLLFIILMDSNLIIATKILFIILHIDFWIMFILHLLCCHECLQSKQLLGVQCFICLCHIVSWVNFGLSLVRCCQLKSWGGQLMNISYFFSKLKQNFAFSFPSVHLNRRTAAFRWYRTHWELLLLQSYFMRTSEVTNWGIYLFFSFFQLLNLQKLVMWENRTRETSRLVKRNRIWKIAQSSVIKRATRR